MADQKTYECAIQEVQPTAQEKSKISNNSTDNSHGMTEPVSISIPVMQTSQNGVTSAPVLTKSPPNNLRRLLPAVLFLLTFVTVTTGDTVALGAKQFRPSITRSVQKLEKMFGQDYVGTFMEVSESGGRSPRAARLEAAGWIGTGARAARQDYALHACSPTDHKREITYQSGNSPVGFSSGVLCLPLYSTLAAADCTPGGVNCRQGDDCTGASCEQGGDCTEADCTRGGDCTGSGCKRGGYCGGANCRRGGNCTGSGCVEGGHCTGAYCMQGGNCTGAGCNQGGDCMGANCKWGGDCTGSGCKRGGYCTGASCIRNGNCIGAGCTRGTI